MKEPKLTQDARIWRILVLCAVLLFVCIVCMFITIRYVDKYRKKVNETSLLEQKLENLDQEVKKQDMKTRELEIVRYDLSMEKDQIMKESSIIKERYKSLGKIIKSLEKDINGLNNVLKYVETNKEDPLIDNAENSEKVSRLIALQNRNNELMNELAKKTKENMILKIALESQSKRLGLSENYDSELKEILKKLVTSLQ